MNGVPEEVKVLLMPEAEVIMEGAYVRLRDFQRKGGKLVAFKSRSNPHSGKTLLEGAPRE